MRILLATLLLAQEFQVIPPPPPPPPSPPPGLIGAPPVSAIPQDGEGVIQGVLRRSDNGEPLRDNPVQLRTAPGPGRPQSALSAMTDAGGKFEFKSLPAGSYAVSASRRGFFVPSSNGLPADTIREAVSIDSVKKTVNLAMALIPGGIITGTVRDSDGQAAVSIPVTAMRVRYRNGRRTLVRVNASAPTDDRGQFRLAALPPGDYYIRADVRPTPLALAPAETGAFLRFALRTGAISSGISTALPASFSPQYSPGTLDPQSAVAVKLRGGDEVIADVRMAKASLVRISGTVVNTIPDIATDPIGFLLVPRDTGGFDEGTASILLNNIATDKSGGRFEILTARTGAYDLVAVAARRNVTPGFALPDLLSGKMPVEVGNRDIENLKISIVSGVDLNVHLTAPAVISNAAEYIQYSLRSLDLMDSTPLIQDVGGIFPGFKADLKFPGLPEGRYQIELPEKPSNSYVSDVRQGSRSISTDGVINVGNSAAESVEIVLSPGGATVSGTIQGAGGVAVLPTPVVLVPQGSRRGNPIFYVRTQSANGTFSLRGIAPGEYKLYAFESLPTSADENATFMSQYEGSGRVLSLRENSAITDINIPLIRAN